jgi:hypothetical protein
MCEAVDAILSTLRKRSSRKSKRAQSSKRTNSDVNEHQQVNKGSEGDERAVTHVDVIVDATPGDNEQKESNGLGNAGL